MSGRKLAYLRSRPEPTHRLSEEDKKFVELFGEDPRGAYQELVVADTGTWQKTVYAVFTEHPELHAAEGTGPAVIAKRPATLTWWSGDHVLYVRCSGVYRFDIRTASYQRSKVLTAIDIADARSSPEGMPLALEVVDGGRDVACLVDPMTGHRVWSTPSAAGPPCYSPDGDRLAWIEYTGEAPSPQAAIVVRRLGARAERRYAPHSDLLDGQYDTLWWIRDTDTLVVASMIYPLGQMEGRKPFDVGVWRVGSERIRRVGIRTEGLDMFTPL